jgi:hypothetical protein
MRQEPNTKRTTDSTWEASGNGCQRLKLNPPKDGVFVPNGVRKPWRTSLLQSGQVKSPRNSWQWRLALLIQRLPSA